MLEHLNETDTGYHQFNDALSINESLNKTLKLYNKGQIGLLLLDGELIDTVDIFFSLLTFAGVTIDSIFLTLHLVAFYLNPLKKTLPEKNVASLCMALLVSHIFFLIGLVFREICNITSIVAYYFTVAYFFWMLVMSFDVWRSIRAALKLRLNENGEQKKFILYSICSWFMAGIGTMIPVSLLMLPEEYVADEFRPSFVKVMCGLKQDAALQWIFNITSTVVITLNLILFIHTSCLISKFEGKLAGISSQSVTKNSQSKTFQAEDITHEKMTESNLSLTDCVVGCLPLGAFDTFLNIRRFISLTFQTGLIWIVFLVIYFIFDMDNKLLWYIFVFLGSLSGIFIFCLFTCTKGNLLPVLDRIDSGRHKFYARRKTTLSDV